MVSLLYKIRAIFFRNWSRKIASSFDSTKNQLNSYAKLIVDNQQNLQASKTAAPNIKYASTMNISANVRTFCVPKIIRKTMALI